MEEKRGKSAGGAADLESEKTVMRSARVSSLSSFLNREKAGPVMSDLYFARGAEKEFVRWFFREVFRFESAVMHVMSLYGRKQQPVFVRFQELWIFEQAVTVHPERHAVAAS
jgi:hypothetical protein